MKFSKAFFFNIFRTTKGSDIICKNDQNYSTNLHKNFKFQWNNFLNKYLDNFLYKFFLKALFKTQNSKRISIQIEENKKTSFFFMD